MQWALILNFKKLTNMKYLSYSLIFVLCLMGISCNEEEWLREEPYSFYAPENSYITRNDFNSAVARLYQQIYTSLYDINGDPQRALQYPTDIAYDAIALEHGLNLYSGTVFPVTSQITSTWNAMYAIIYNANVILNRIEGDAVEIEDRGIRDGFIAEARFFRAMAYRSLAILFGGVPLVLEETQEPKRDFVRASKEEVLRLCEEDLLFAIGNLPDITDVSEEGRLCKAAAQHLLTEVYIMLQEWDKAIAQASAVISNPNFQLMTERFGTRKNEPGDVYWDLFRRDNQNRSSGNLESIFVNQFEYLKEGGGNSQVYPRFLNPLYWQLTGVSDGKPLFIGPSNHYGGRGIGWFAANDYLINQVWEGSEGDMRNSDYNIVRDIRADHPESAYFGQLIVANNAFNPDQFPLNRGWTVQFIKTIPINNFPEEFILDPVSGLTNNNANNTFTESYVFRLAGTYLLRAEAYIGKGDQQNAANDINAVRRRANAPEVAPADVDLDYLLDERARELCWEELRVMTLMRTGKFVERVRQYNVVSKDYISDHQGVWPIPASEIERNTEAVLEQNQGY